MAGIGEEIQDRLRRWTLELGGPGTRERLQKLTPPRNEYGVDPYGFDVDYLQAAAAPVLWLYRKYFRVKAIGTENVPNEGPVLLIANHSGQLPVVELRVAEVDLVGDDEPPARGEDAEPERAAVVGLGGVERADARVLAGEVGEDGGGAVARAVLGEDDLEVVAAGVERGDEVAAGGVDDRLLVEDGDDDGERRSRSVRANPRHATRPAALRPASIASSIDEYSHAPQRPATSTSRSSSQPRTAARAPSQAASWIT